MNLSDGTLTPLVTGFSSPKGLLYVSPADDSAQPPPAGPPAPGLAAAPTGERAGALKKCKKKHSHKARKKCKKKANLLPV